jgi:serine phosphatase RsbU (regulator of sigma subunit)/tetratricopeptide (TPR) repeat protein
MKNLFQVFFRITLLIITVSLVFCSKTLSQNPADIDSLKQLLVEAKQDTNHIYVLLKLGDRYHHSLPDSATYYYHKALEISEKVDYDAGRAKSYRSIGNILQLKGANDSALEYLMKAQSTFIQIGDREGLATCYNNIGYTHKLKGEYDKAIEYFYMALEIADELGDKRQMARTYNNIGSVHQMGNSNDKAIEVFEKSLYLYSEIGYTRGKAICSINLGISYFNEGDFEKALEYHENALVIHSENNNRQGISICYINMSEIYRNLGMYDKAIEYSLKSVDLFEEMGYKEGMASAYANLASFNIGLADPLTLSRAQWINYLNKSIEYGDKAIELAREMRSLYIESSVATSLVGAYKRLGNYKKALEFSEIVIVTRDSMFQEEKTNAILEIETKYETEKKQQQIELQESQLVAKDATIKQQKIYRNALAAGFSSVVLIVIIIVYAYVQKRKANKKIVEQNDQILEANEELKVLNEAINKQNHEIIDSISYAERIQAAMLPPPTYITELLNENFVLYKPRDIVSGDFYWIKQVNQYVVLVAADCTGHGVPGAFMSMLGISYLTEIVHRRQITQANQVLNELRKQIKLTLRQHGERDEAKDGIDMVLCVLDLKNNMMQYSGANNPLYLIRDVNGKPELKEFNADRMPLGYYQGKDRAFTNHDIELEEGDTIYLFSDGFIDQKGGKDNKRYMSKGFKNTLLEIQDQDMHDQKDILDKRLSDWMGSNSQLDDILVIGVRV